MGNNLYFYRNSDEAKSIASKLIGSGALTIKRSKMIGELELFRNTFRSGTKDAILVKDPHSS